MQLSMEQAQKQILSASLINSLSLLQIGNLELMEYINQIVLENPTLETNEIGLRSAPISASSIHTNESQASSADSLASYQKYFEVNIRDYLLDQFHLSFDEAEVRLLNIIVDSLDENGFLDASPAELCRLAGCSQELAEAGIYYLQMLEPAGIGARNLQECLKLQLHRLVDEPAIPCAMIDQHLEDIALGHFSKIARTLKVSPELVRQYADLIKTLNPFPLQGFSSGESVKYILADAYIDCDENGKLHCCINEESLPQLTVSDYYRQMLRQSDDLSTAEYLSEKLSQSEWVVKAVLMRRKTLTRIVELIADVQRPFFTENVVKLVPMSLKDAAERLGLSVSTVSRAINAKHLSCNRGVLPFKYFFSLKVPSLLEEGVSRNDSKQRIAQLIAAEDPTNPMSDSKITERLTAEGITLSRRAVAKYRDELGIGSTMARKKKSLLPPHP